MTNTERAAHDAQYDILAAKARDAYKTHGPHSAECQNAMSALRAHDQVWMGRPMEAPRAWPHGKP